MHGYVANGLLGRLVGARLCSVQFVYDYVQLRFDCPGGDLPVLTCDAMPTVVVAHGTYTDGRPGYADALRSLIAATVVSTEEAVGVGLRLELDTGVLSLHPTPAELTGPEIATLDGFTDDQWMCRRPGEDSFEDLA
ncbi:hypothetical protein ACFV4N_14915 [Actinosynnema sp. NPDC059797]